MAKQTFVKLQTRGKEDKIITRDFNVQHAERILRLENSGHWELPKDSKFEFVNNGLQLKNAK